MLTPQQLTSVEEQLDLLVDVCTWFGTAPNITVQEFADALREEDELDFGDYDDMSSVYDLIPEDSPHYWC